MRLFTAVVAAAAALFAPQVSQAACFGGSTFQTCSDSNGNNYTVQRYGNSTNMQGYSSSTGSNWSQNSQTYGNSTFTQGNSNGRSWNMHQQRLGSGSIYSGTDTRGNSFSGYSR